MKFGIGIGVLTLLAVGALYGPHVRVAPFVYEDDRLLQIAADPVSWAGLRQGRGLTMESWRMLRTPQASHALNLGLHMAVVGLVGLLLWQLTARADIALGVAAIVALHPLSVEGVAYAASRAELLAAVFVLLALVAATADVSWGWAAVPALIGLAYLGKESGVVGIALIPLALWLKGDRAWSARVAWLCVGVLVLLAVTAAPTLASWMHIGEGPQKSIDPDAWMAQQAVATWRLVLLSVAPFWLSVAPDVTAASGWAQAGSALLLVALLEVAWRCRHTAPLATFGIVWCALVVAPRFLIRTPWSPLNEHQFYLALPGMACCWVATLDVVERWLRATTWPAALVPWEPR